MAVNNDVLFGRLVRKDVHLRGPPSSDAAAAAGCSATAAFPPEIQLCRDKFTVGRSNVADCCIFSANISKTHAVFRRLAIDGVPTSTYTITDCKSTNGVFINGVRLAPNTAQTLSLSDEVCFQCKTDEPRTTYVFLLEPTVSVLPPPPYRQTVVIGPSTSSRSQSDVDDGRDQPKRIKLDDIGVRTLQLQNELLRDKLDQQKREFEENLRDQIDGAAAREAEMKLRNQKVQEQLDQAEYRIREGQRIADEEKAKSDEDKSRMEQEISRLMQEKSRLEQENSNLEAAMLLASDECRDVTEKLQAAEAAAEEAAAAHSSQSSSSQKNDLANVLKNMLETECQCIICSELFCKTTTLQCAHSYCQYCISEWQKKKADCPICRQPISAFVPTLVVDAFIDRTVDMLPGDVKARREELIAERNLLTTQVNVGANATTVAAIPVNQQRVRVTRRARDRPTAATVHSPTRPTLLHAANVIELSSSQSDSDTSVDFEYESSTEEFDDSDVDSGPRAYYGGYGHCFVCGETGHWANGCPHR